MGKRSRQLLETACQKNDKSCRTIKKLCGGLIKLEEKLIKYFNKYAYSKSNLLLRKTRKQNEQTISNLSGLRGSTKSNFNFGGKLQAVTVNHPGLTRDSIS